MTRESLSKKQGCLRTRRHGRLKPTRRRPIHLFSSLLGALFSGVLISAGCLADEATARVLSSSDVQARTVTGDVVRIPLGQQAGSPDIGALPRTGASRESVLRQLGEPRERRDAVGEPPISSWEYADVVVHFEHDHVIHAVRKHVPVSGGR